MFPDDRPALPSILFDRQSDHLSASSASAPDFYGDLKLEQIVNAITEGWDEYDLKPFFSFPLSHADSIRYRHEVFRDLEDMAVFEQVESFARQMHNVRLYTALATKLYNQFHKEGWLLYAIELYCAAVKQFAVDLASAPITSHGLVAFRDYLTGYAASSPFAALKDEAEQLAADLARVRYSILIRDNSFTVRDYESQTDYSAEIEETFKRFQQGAVKDYKVRYRYAPEDMNHIEGAILEFIARLNPDLFSRLLAYCARHAHFIDEPIATFDRESRFYIAYLKHIARFRRAGLAFCYPEVSARSKSVHVHDAFDLALARKLADEQPQGKKKPDDSIQPRSIVCNDFTLQGQERIIVVTGPNQGGKTTFARMFGQLHYLANLGCPVPGRDARLFLFDQLFTHFEREEKVENLRGKLEGDLVRVRSILQRATPQSVIVMNEVFTSTTVQDELFLSKRVIERLNKLDVLCVWVTFLDELASFSEKTVSMVSTIVPENPALRTFKIVRCPADGLAYAMAIAEKYRLTYGRIKERI